MNATSLVWIIVGIVVVVVVVGLIVYFARQRNREHLEKQRAADKRQAADLRQNAQKVELDARENEAQASRVRADATQVEVDAERLRRESAQREADAQNLHVSSTEQARHAEKLDPIGDDDPPLGAPMGTERTTGTTHTTDDPRSPRIRGEDDTRNLTADQPKSREDDHPQTDDAGSRER